MNLFQANCRDVVLKDVQSKKLHFTLILLLATFLANIVSHNSFAIVKTYDWNQNHRGYSIEQVPGTGLRGGPAIEYVAAGTVHDINTGQYGWHFMHLDANGTIISDRTSWSDPDDNQDFRVVDIAAADGNTFWITIQVRDKTPGAEEDYIYIAGVDITGADLPLNPATAIRSIATQGSHKNLYPTHSYFASNGTLNICGYAADNTQYPNEPKNSSTSKYGIFIECYLSSGPVAYASYAWETGGNAGRDFDMPLRIAPSSRDSEYPLLVTGAVNSSTDNNLSGVLLMKFDPFAILTTFNGISGTYSTINPDEVKGDFGVDIRTMYYDGINTNPDYIILANSFNDDNPYDKTTGIIRVKNNLQSYSLSHNSYLRLNDTKAWGKQFNEITVPDKSVDQFITVVGEQIGIYNDEGCGVSISAPNMTPSKLNVNPFIAGFAINGSSVWSASSGFANPYPSGFWIKNVVHLSSQGTQAMFMDYLGGSYTYGTSLEDVSRLYTFANRSHYYYSYPWSPPGAKVLQYPTILAPVAENVPVGGAVSNPNLLAKFITTDHNFRETVCSNYVEDCPSLTSISTFDDALFGSVQYDLVPSNAYSYFTLTNYFNAIPPEIDCVSGFYKPTNVNSTNSNGRIEIYPNPATDELNVKFPNNTNEAYTFTLTDVTGKVVHTKNGTTNNSATIKLPNVSSGVYIATVSIGGKNHIEKVTIQ